MAYDIRGGWDSFTGFNAPLYKTSVDTTNEFNVVRKKKQISHCKNTNKSVIT